MWIPLRTISGPGAASAKDDEMDAQRFWATLKSHGLTFFSGVPCSLLKSLLIEAEADPEVTYLPAAREDTALGLASGAYMCGRPGGILIQNSGLGNVVNGLTSFNLPYRIPILMVISWRGETRQDAPEHWVMGEKMLSLLDLLGIPSLVFSPKATDGLSPLFREMLETRLPAALILREGMIG